MLLTETNPAMPATGAEGARFIGGSGCRVALVDQPNSEGFQSELTAIGINASKVGHVSGLNVNRGKVLDIDVWVKP